MSEVTYTVHEEPVSLEAAKLLGFAFTWGLRGSAYKLVPSDKGLLPKLRWLDGRVERWETSGYHDNYPALEHALMTGNEGQPYTLYRVTFSDEETTNVEG